MAKITKTKMKEAEYLEIRPTKDLEQLVNEVLSEETRAMLDMQVGVRSALDHIVTQVMKRSYGKADPHKIRRMILNKLE
jgi:Asp-tRNA(Asn)/Glu-tRNA(Gln) amidotransferase B subunit